jgi:hypothetical protein
VLITLHPFAGYVEQLSQKLAFSSGVPGAVQQTAEMSEDDVEHAVKV